MHAEQSEDASKVVYSQLQVLLNIKKMQFRMSARFQILVVTHEKDGSDVLPYACWPNAKLETVAGVENSNVSPKSVRPKVQDSQ